MKKTYIAPSIQVVDLDKEMPVLCASGGQGGITTPNNSRPTNDNDQNIFSVNKGGWNASHWNPAEEEDED